LLLVVAVDFAHSVDALGGVKHVVDDVLGVVGARHGEFVIDIDDRRGTSGPKPESVDW
jgi:hypothetical protein